MGAFRILVNLPKKGNRNTVLELTQQSAETFWYRFDEPIF